MSNTILLDLTKKFELNLEKAGVVDIPTLEVLFAIDKSGSMASLYSRGFVDRTVNLFLPLALKFDDNQQIEMGFFNSSYHEAPFATEADVGCYMRKAGQRADGGTNFAPIIEAFETQRGNTVMQEVTETVTTPAKGLWGKLTGKTETKTVTKQVAVPAAQNQYRAYAAIVTDGDNFDKDQFEAELAKTSGGTFYQLIGIGGGVPERYLESIAAKYAHVAFFHLPDPMTFTDDDFYKEIVNSKFTAWM